MKKFIEKITIYLFVGSLWCGLIVHVLSKDHDVSMSERRHLKKKPQLTYNNVISGTYTSEFETYMADQFPYRDTLRSIESKFCLNVLQMLEHNGLYIKDDSISKLDPNLRIDQVNHFINTFTRIQNKYFNDSNVYVALIPDKNYYLTKNTLYPRMDYDTLFEMVKDGLNHMAYIDLTNCLNKDSYYKTDPHIKQEMLETSINTMMKEMNQDPIDFDSYTKHVLDGFYGAYYGQLGLPIDSDELVYLTNDVLDQVNVMDVEKNQKIDLYDLTKMNGIDGYDVFLDGPKAILTIENKQAKGNDELIVFRDSFGSSIVPMFVENYKKITLIDIRYVNSNVLDQFVEFKDQDVLILYSTMLVNSSSSLH